MLHPSYTDLMKVVNSEVEEGEEKVVNSRYSIVLATSKRARQLIDHAEPKVDTVSCPKPLSIAIEELKDSKIRILGDDEDVAIEEILDGVADDFDEIIDATEELEDELIAEEASGEVDE